MNFISWLSLLALIGLPFVAFAIVIHAMERLIQRRLAERFGWKSVLWTGWLGTPIHELSHVLMCYVFRHRVDEVVFFEPDAISGRLGYVRHSYRRGNWFEELGSVFIGLAPLVGGSLALLMLLALFYPSAASNALADTSLGTFSGLSRVGQTIGGVLKEVVQIENLATVRFWVFVYLVLCVSSHMAPSRTDYQGVMGRGALLFIVLLAAVMIIASIFVKDVGAFTQTMIELLSPLFALLAIATILCLLATTIVALGLSYFPQRFVVR